jgi:tetratricopeptide (TPR) repeat protein
MSIALFALTATPQAYCAAVSEEDSIMALLRRETQTFYQRDFAGWQATWAHDAQATRTLVSDGSYSAAVGWDKIGPGVANYLKANATPIAIELAIENNLIHVSDRIAWVEYDQVIGMTGAKSSTTRRSREHRALIKQAGQWKIISQLTHDPETFGTGAQGIEAAANMLGYRLLSAGKISAAIEIFSVNARLNPASWNAYDSLGEAYAKAQNQELAIKSYEHSLQLNPGSASGKAALEKLRGQ